MSRTTATLILCLGCSACADPDHAALIGKWKVARYESEGKVASLEKFTSILTIEDGRGDFGLDGGEGKFTYTIDPSRSPKHLDITFGGSMVNGAKALDIYKLDGDRLTICSVSLRDGGETRPAGFSSEGKGNAVVEYRRVGGAK